MGRQGQTDETEQEEEEDEERSEEERHAGRTVDGDADEWEEAVWNGWEGGRMAGRLSWHHWLSEGCVRVEQAGWWSVVGKGESGVEVCGGIGDVRLCNCTDVRLRQLREVGGTGRRRLRLLRV